MRLKQPAQSDDPCDMFRSELIQMIDPEHELVQLSHRIHWKKLDQAFGEYYVESVGSPGKSTRLMAGLQYLKYLYNLSDEELVKRWVERISTDDTFYDYDGPAEVHVVGKRKRSSALKKWMQRRSAIEATIGQLKQSSRLDRKTLKGKIGDCINPILSACGWNLHLILVVLRQRRPFFGLFQSIRRWIMGGCMAYDNSDNTYIPNMAFAN